MKKAMLLTIALLIGLSMTAEADTFTLFSDGSSSFSTGWYTLFSDGSSSFSFSN